MVAKNILVILILTTLFSVSMYSEAMLPSCITNYKLGTEQYIVIVEKSSHKLMIYSNYMTEPIETFNITTGKKSGQKMSEGDYRTPEGIYFFRRILNKSELPKVDDYGEKAFTMNYPNAFDYLEKRTGSGIWLHGANNTKKLDNPNNSRGCVVLNNSDMVKISKYIFLNKTPICIYDKVPMVTESELISRRETLLNNLKSWKKHWEAKDIDKYIDKYDSSFKHKNMNRTEFKVYKKRLNKIYKFIKVHLSDVNILDYRKYTVVTFNQLYISDKNHFYNRKEQYWKRNSDGKYRIIYERNSSLPSLNSFEISKGNYISIDNYRKRILTKLRSESEKIELNTTGVRAIIKDKNTIRLKIRTSGRISGKKYLIPVLLFRKNRESLYKSSEDIDLQNGVPTDYSKAIPAEELNNISFRIPEDYNLKSLTIFYINSNKNRADKVTTHFISQ